MRSGTAHRRNSAFVRSSSLGEIHATPVIKEVTIRRGNSKPRVIVRDGAIFNQKFGFRRYDKITFDAKLIGAGYFYATVMVRGHPHLLFVTKAQSNVSYEIELDAPLDGLNFHIAPRIPTNLNPRFADPMTRSFLKAMPEVYSSLGFVPTQPYIPPSELPNFPGMPNITLPEGYGVKPTETPSGKHWDGNMSNHKWSYGRTGTDITPGENVKLWENYDAGWLAAAAMYKYTGTEWECIQGNTNYLQVGQPLCIVGQMYGYYDAWGAGGEYHYYSDSHDDDDLNWSSADKMGGEHIRLIELSARNALADRTSTWYDKQKFFIQDKGGSHKLNHNGGVFWADNDETDKFCAKVEWWNPKTNTWSEPRIYPDYDASITSKGRYAFYYRFPRQLTETDDHYEITPFWQISKTAESYPRLNTTSDSPTYGDVVYNRIGRPDVGGVKDTSIEITTPSGQVLSTSKESPFYSVLMCPEAQTKGKGSEYQKKRFICPTGAALFCAVDPYSFSYADNPDILGAYWVNGNFKPGGSFMLLGKATDFFPGFWISTESLSKKHNTPMDLSAAQFDMTRGNHQPNELGADKIKDSNMRTFKSTDIDNPKKVAEFQASWDICFPGVPLTKQILVAILSGDQLPDLEEIDNTKLPGFLEDDPLRYEVDYKGVKFRHSYSLVYCKLPEGWWGPTVDLEDDTLTSVYLGGQNHYMYIKEEKINLETEIEAQRAKEAAGATAAEAFADSELEEPMVDITYEAYMNRNEVVKENINAKDAAKKDLPWWKQTSLVNLKHQKFSLLGSAGVVTDVTNQYSADHITGLDGLSSRNATQYQFNELFVVDGLGNSPSIVLTPPKEPTGGVPLKHSNVSGFGNSERSALKARALGNGNPMKYSTEEKQDSLQIAPMGTVLDTALGLDDGAIMDTVTTGMYLVGGLVALGAIIKLKPMFDNMATAAALKKTAKNRQLESEMDLINGLKKVKAKKKSA